MPALPHDPSPRRRYARILGSGAGLGLVALLVAGALAWHGHLPGTWWLRQRLQDRPARMEWLRQREVTRRLAELRVQNERAPAGATVFLGSSTVERFPLEHCFPGRTVLNRGVLGLTSAELGEHLEELLPSVPAAAFVLQVGGNDLRREGVEPEVLRERVAAILERLRARAPAAPIALVGLFPVLGTAERDRARMERANALLEALARRQGCAFVPTDRPPLRAPSGALALEYAFDPHHLNDAGYRLLAGWILEEAQPLAAFLSPEHP